MELITKPIYKGYSDYVNDLTKEMDEHLIDEYKKAIPYGGETYIFYRGKAQCYAIRVPGATRGHIEVDENNVIKTIEFYGTAFNNSVACYKSSVKDAVQKFIGYKLIISE